MQLVKISEVKPNPKNTRVIRDEKFNKLVKSIQEFPDMLNKRPLIVFTDVDNKYVVLGGNMRLQACKEVGIKEIPIIVADEWTEEQKAEFLIKDNVGFGEWDWDSLANEWDVEKLEDWGLDLPIGLSVEELEAQEDEFDVPEGGIETDIVIGDLFEIGEHRLLCGRYSSAVSFEFTTPTGAAILSTLGSAFGPLPQMKIGRIAHGAGGKDLPDQPNVLRLMTGEPVTTYEEDTSIVIETNIDDMNPQLYGHLTERASRAARP